MRVPYTKMHGTGNLILIVDQRENNLPPPDADRIRILGDPDTGPGFDQMMWLSAATDGTSIASYRVFNADGTEVEQCGNGIRCLARYLSDSSPGQTEMTLQSPAGPIAARVYGDDEIAVGMGVPVFEPQRIPFVAESQCDTYPLEIDAQLVTASVLSMGNPHAVIPVEDIGSAPVSDWGPKLEHHERFPDRTNVGFMQVSDRQNINLRVHERGVGETAACGTGACAAVVAGQRNGELDEEVTVHLPGGKVVVSWRGGGDPVWLRGNAETINGGMMELQG